MNKSLKKCVVIVGGGYVGINLVCMLDDYVEVILVEFREMFVYNVVVIWLFIEFVLFDKLLILYDCFFKNG